MAVRRAAATGVVAAVRRDLERLPDDLRGSGLAALAVAMAERIDTGRGSPSECGKVLMDALARLAELAPPVKEATWLDELNARREARLAQQARPRRKRGDGVSASTDSAQAAARRDIGR